MGFWNKVEKWSEKHVEGFFKTKFSGAVQPADMAKAIAREMRDRKTVSVSKIYIPNEYTVFVGQKDWEHVSPIVGSLALELQDFIRHKADQRKYAMVGPATVKFECKERLAQGLVEVVGRFTELLPDEKREVKAKAEPDAKGEANVGVSNHTIVVQREDVLSSLVKQGQKPLSQNTLVNGTRIIAVVKVKNSTGLTREHPIGTKAVLIGRRRTCDIQLLDENVSRTHAEIVYADGGHKVEDRGSTNGVFVNGQRVMHKKLMDGDLIKVGNSILEYKVV